jgi:predicted nucleic acid-binding protein
MVVVDANLLVALVSGDPRGNQVLQHFTDWLSHNVEIHAPLLAQYETANALTGLIVAGAFPAIKLKRRGTISLSCRLRTTNWQARSGSRKSPSR